MYGKFCLLTATAASIVVIASSAHAYSGFANLAVTGSACSSSVMPGFNQNVPIEFAALPTSYGIGPGAYSISATIPYVGQQLLGNVYAVLQGAGAAYTYSSPGFLNGPSGITGTWTGTITPVSFGTNAIYYNFSTLKLTYTNCTLTLTGGNVVAVQTE